MTVRDVAKAVGSCEVSALPGRRGLRLVWVRPLTVVVAEADGAAAPSQAPVPRSAAIALLDAYRVSRVPWAPERAAS